MLTLKPEIVDQKMVIGYLIGLQRVITVNKTFDFNKNFIYFAGWAKTNEISGGPSVGVKQSEVGRLGDVGLFQA